MEKLGIATPEPVYEQIVGGGKRLIERAVGYRAIFVNGVMTFEHDKCTGKLPGRVVRTSAYQPGSSPRMQKNAAAAAKPIPEGGLVAAHDERALELR